MRSTDVETVASDPRAEARARRAGKRLAALSVLCGALALVFAIVPSGRVAGGVFCSLGLFLGMTTLRLVRHRGGAGRELAIAGVVLGGLAAAGTLASLAAFGSVIHREPAKPDVVTAAPALSASEITKRTLAEDLKVEIGTFSLGLDPSGIMSSQLTIVVTNTSHETKSFDVKLEALSPKGKKLTEDSAFVVNLEAGQTANAKVFSIVSNQLAPQLKDAEFKVTEAVSY